MARKKKQTLAIILVAILALASVGMVGLAVAKTESAKSTAVFTPPPNTEIPPIPMALWVGDSYTEGTGVREAGQAYPSVTSRSLGYMPIIDAQGGTGFVNDGKKNVATNVPMADRLQKTSATPKLVVIDGGRNDGVADFNTVVKPAVTSYLDAVKAKWPDATIVLIVPYYIEGKGVFRAFTNFYAEEAKRIGALVIDPMAEGWFNGMNTAPLIYTDKIHPNEAGHKLLAEKFTARLKELGVSAV
ncbi:SGNH/GDSL hydrolase family protein [Paenarthrobacter sp. NPDC057355]|uniref:SGNH/GDSL hydrolase family protein n=1 Tax=Paenarthrobacter sp. NPDC057355 TaxID=3346105 RepID=UPI00363836AD